MRDLTFKKSKNNEFKTAFGFKDISLIFDNLNEKINGLNIDDNKYLKVKKNKGTYGKILILKNFSKPTYFKYFVVKIFESYEDYMKEKLTSIIISNIQNETNCCLNIIPSYWYESEKTNFIIMHHRTGSISNLIYQNIYYDKINIFIKIVRSIYELYLFGIYYCDVKSGNILYENYNDNINITLGDIGGLIFSNNFNTHNLFNSIAFQGDKIKLVDCKYDQFIKIKIKKRYSDDFHTIGYSEYEKNKIFELNKEINIEEINDKKAKINQNSLEGDMKNLYIYYENAIFTFPHFKNSSGVVIINLEKYNDDDIRNVLMNNIFQGLGVTLIEILLKSYFKFTNDLIEIYYDDSVEIVKYKIFNLDISHESKNILLDILFYGNNINPLISKKYSNYKNSNNVELQFENLLNILYKLKI